MKALISPNEIFTYSWATAWEFDKQVDGTDGLVDQHIPILAEIQDCVRVADVAEQPFEVAEPMFWVDCDEDCTRDNCYYKDGVVSKKSVWATHPNEV